MRRTAWIVVAGFAAMGTVGAQAARAQAPYYGTVTVQIPVNQSWTDTGVDLVAGQRVIIAAWGTAAGSGVVSGVPQWFGPDGVGDNCQDPLKPFPGAYDMLIGRVGGGGTAFAVGSFRGVAATTNGRLYLGMNDGATADNTGFFVAVIYANPLTSVEGGQDTSRTFGLSAYPNPATGTCTIALASDGSEISEISVYDVQGRAVRNLAGLLREGQFEVVWDGRNEQGRRVSAGTYFVRAITGRGGEDSSRIVIE